MLVLRRKEGQWVEITHRSGDVLWVRVCNIQAPRQADMAFDDDARNFTIVRPERKPKPDTPGADGWPPGGVPAPTEPLEPDR